MHDRLTFYEPKEERFNFISHGVGLVLSFVALSLLIIYSSLDGAIAKIASVSVYGISLIILYSASTLYHYVQEPKLRFKLNILDHAAIYILIAGSYTPFTIIVYEGTFAWTMFGTIWVIAILGVTLKLFFTGRYGLISTIAYVVMGWIGILGIKILIHDLPIEGVIWLIAGGIFYTMGAILFGLKKIRFNHAIFHVFVLLGSFCHFISIFVYVIPYERS